MRQCKQVQRRSPLALTAAREEGSDFVFLDSPGRGLNGFVVDPSKVVALIHTTSRR